MSDLVAVSQTGARGCDSFLLMVCFVVALGLRLAIIGNQAEQLTQDRDVYLATAIGVAQGRGYSVPDSSVPSAFRPPVYPLSLAASLLAFSPKVSVAAINVVSGLLTVWLTASLGAWLQLGRGRFVAAFLVAVDPLLLRYASQPMTESLCTFLAVFWLWTMTIKRTDSDRASWLHGLLMGFAFGLLALSRPTFWPIAGIYGFVWLAVKLRNNSSLSSHRRHSDLQIAVCSVIGAMTVVAPWVVRNWLVFSVPILTTTHGGYTLLLGNNPVFYEEVVRKPWGLVWSESSLRDWNAGLSSRIEQELGPHPTDIQIDAWESRQAWSYIAAHPSHFFQAAVHRVRSLWNTIPQGEATGVTSGIAITVIGWYYTVVLAAGFLGACLVVHRGDVRRWLPLYVLVFTVQLVHLFYWTNTRMRAPLVPAIALFAAALIPNCRADAASKKSPGS